MKEEFQFVQAMTKLQLKKNSSASVVDVARELFAIIGKPSPTEPVMPMKQFLAEQESHLLKDEVESLLSESSNDPLKELWAPHPVVNTVEHEPYDSLQAAKMLPVFDKLPDKFGATDYSAIKLNEQTAAIASEHYFDLIAIRDECQTLREDNKQLQAVAMQMSRRQIALDQLAVIGVGISQLDGMFVVNTGDVSVCDESLTDCLEQAVEQMRENIKATAQEYFSPDDCVNPAEIIAAELPATDTATEDLYGPF